MVLPNLRYSFKLLQNSPVSSPSPLVRAGLSPISPLSPATSSFGAASARYIESAELRRSQRSSDYVRPLDSHGESLERLRAKTARSGLPPLF